MLNYSPLFRNNARILSNFKIPKLFQHTSLRPNCVLQASNNSQCDGPRLLYIDQNYTTEIDLWTCVYKNV